MRQSIFCLSFFIAACLVSCKTESLNSCETTAAIIGQDLTLCGCCGGIFVEIDNDTFRITQGETDSLYQEALALDSGTVVGLSWELATPCLGDEIVINCLDLGLR